jgi:hypothetical protein
MQRAANIAFTLFAVVELLFASVAVRSGLLKARLHWLARGGAAIIVGAGLSYLLAIGSAWRGRAPAPFPALERAVADWIRNLV